MVAQPPEPHHGREQDIVFLDFLLLRADHLVNIACALLDDFAIQRRLFGAHPHYYLLEVRCWQVKQLLCSAQADCVEQCLQAEGSVWCVFAQWIKNISHESVALRKRFKVKKLEKRSEIFDSVLDRCTCETPSSGGHEALRRLELVRRLVANPMCCVKA